MEQPQIPPKLAAANAAFAAGRVGDATDLIASALKEQPSLPIKVYRVLIGNLIRLGRLGEGMDWTIRALDLAPDDVEIRNFHGVLLRMKGRLDEALEAFDQLLGNAPDHRGALINKGHLLNEQRKGEEAEAIFRQLLIAEPTSADLHRSLGKALWTQGNHEAAAQIMRQAIALAPAQIDSWLDLSAIVAESNGAEIALSILNSAIDTVPESPRLLEARAVMFRRAGLIDQLGPFLDGLASRHENSAWFQSERGHFVARFDRQAANAHYRCAIELDPTNPDYRLALIANLGRTRGVNEGAFLDEACTLLRQLPVSEQRRASKVAVETFMLCADHEGLRCLGSMAELGRTWATAGQHTALLFQFPRAESAEDRFEILRQHQLWGDMARNRAALQPIAHPVAPSASTKIRIGFMSSDLREHVVTHFAWPLFEHADRDRFEIYCYSWFQAPEPPPLQRKIAAMADVFRWHPFIGDRDAAQMIADDQLDILFEMGGSTAMNKLEVMAWKPAPICASWLAYPHSAGLDNIDYLLLDPFLTPPDPALLVEKPLLMPRSWIAMGEHIFSDRHPIDPVAPIHRNGHVSFGSANSPIRYNPMTLRTWARILARVPGSRFIFVRPEAGSRHFQRNVLGYFEEEGVGAEQVEFRAVRGAHMPHYNDIDITLDTFPQTGGGGTNCEALWMGVPTVTLVDEALYGRLSYSILNNAGLADLCAGSPEEFIDIAVRLAGDSDRIQTLRTGLRDQLRASPLGQTRQFARDFYDLVARTVEERLGKRAAH